VLSTERSAVNTGREAEEISGYVDVTKDSSLMNYCNQDIIPGSDPVGVCGDDLIALRRSLERSLIFKEIALRYGFRLSWKDAISQRIGIFCEDHMILDNNGKLLYIDVVKSRLLTPMARQHSDNRSSILGKGRMLRNQLDYFENKALKKAIMFVYHSVFNRIYSYQLDGCALPLWLPPSCGGLGFPMEEGSLPDHAWKYIKYVLDLIKLDPIERYVQLSSLRVLNSPSKKGISTWESSRLILDKVFKEYKILSYEKGTIDEQVIKDKVIYPDDFIVDLLELADITVPTDPYDQTRFDWDSLQNEVSLLGFIKADQFLNEIERFVNFQTFLEKEEERKQRSLASWMRSSSKFWRSVGVSVNFNTQSITRSECPSFTTFAKLEKSVLYALNGWIYVGHEQLNLFNCTPSLKVDFRTLRKSRQGRLTGNVSVPDLIKILMIPI